MTSKNVDMKKIENNVGGGRNPRMIKIERVCHFQASIQLFCLFSEQPLMPSTLNCEQETTIVSCRKVFHTQWIETKKAKLLCLKIKLLAKVRLTSIQGLFCMLSLPS